MMNHAYTYIRSCSACISDLAVCALLFYMIPAVFGSTQVVLCLVPWVFLVLAQVLINHILTGRGISVNAYLCWNILAAAAVTWYVEFHSLGPADSTEFRWALGLFSLLISGHAAYASARLPGANTLVRYVDIFIIILPFYLYVMYQLDRRLAGPATTLTLLSMVLNLLTVNQIRTRQEGAAVIQGSSAASKAILAVLLGFITAVTAAIIGFASGQVHSAVDLFIILMGYVFRIVEAVLMFFTMTLGYIFYFFLLLFPNTPAAVQKSDAYQMKEQVMNAAADTAKAAPAWVWLTLLALSLLGGLAFIFHLFSGRKMKQRRSQTISRHISRKSHRMEAFLALVRRLSEEVLFEIRYLKNRRSPEGLLVFSQRLGAHTPLACMKNESPGEYFRRLAKHSDQPETLIFLARTLEQHFYGSSRGGKENPLTPEEYRRCRCVIKECFGQQ